jgi:hypothetical protein
MVEEQAELMADIRRLVSEHRERGALIKDILKTLSLPQNRHAAVGVFWEEQGASLADRAADCGVKWVPENA